PLGDHSRGRRNAGEPLRPTEERLGPVEEEAGGARWVGCGGEEIAAAGINRGDGNERVPDLQASEGSGVVLSEADSCRKYVLKKLYEAGWDDDRISEQRTFTDGRIVVAGEKARRRPQKRADYLLRFARDFTLAVVEAKAEYRTAGDGMQQAKEYAECLG